MPTATPTSSARSTTAGGGGESAAGPPLLAPLRAFPEIGAASVVLAHTTLAWEMAAWELWGALLRGGALALPFGGTASFDLIDGEE